ncbi:response regulator [Chryseolinea sp. T2]|uniref:response regulator n=1 Tax=Chryseolinea sp. T2 TaxID=3129255 RepID=UPI0030785747
MKTVILIDDDPDELELMQQAINDYYGPVQCAAYSDPEEALKAILSNTDAPPDAVFIDINMPKLTGDMCLQVLRKELSLNNVVIAMISTYMDSENQVFLVRNGADFAFKKPYKIEEYRQVVLQVLHFDKSRNPDTPGSFF